MKIPMVDLKSQYLKIKKEIDSGIANVLNNTEFINGNDVVEFKKEFAKYLNVKNIVTCGNGTDALQIAMMALDLQPGDEIISTDFTFIATIETISLLNLTPIIVDVDSRTFNIDPNKIESAITPKTKAIIPVHLFGQCADMDRILAIANKYNLYVIEDAAQAIGSEYLFADGKKKKAGTIGHIGCTSFFPSKNLGCYGDGGAVFTNDDSLAEKLSTIANHGMKTRYHHDIIGVNSRLDSIQAAILRVKLKYLDNYNSNRLKVADYYDEAFKNCDKIITPKRFEKSTHCFHQYTLILKGVNRTALQEYLNKKGIASAIYYPIPIHAQKAFQKFNFNSDDYPITNELCKNVLSLPIDTELDNNKLDFISKAILEFI